MNRILLASAALVLAAGSAAAAPTSLGVFKDWSAFSNGAGDAKVCFAIARPKSSEPAKAKRDPIAFLINDWPSRRAKAEPEVEPGYQFKDGSKVTVEVGSDKFTLFTKNDSGDGGAWLQSSDDEARLIADMRNGQQLIVTGVSKRGTMTHDTYSLAGISDAVDKIHSECGM
jgi:hypothetical protein